VNDQPQEAERPEPSTAEEPAAERAPEAEPAAPPEPESEPQTPPGPTARRLYRSRDDRVIGGVCGGLGEYFDIDAVLIRIAFVLLVFAGGAGVLAYVLCWIFIPDVPAGAPGALPAPAGDRSTARGQRTGGAVVLGLVFVALGILFLFDVSWPNFLSWKYVWPAALIAVGAAIVVRARR
jgi:phage shock protein PspC (stress-responsive transcriptional regulator)